MDAIVATVEEGPLFGLERMGGGLSMSIKVRGVLIQYEPETGVFHETEVNPQVDPKYVGNLQLFTPGQQLILLGRFGDAHWIPWVQRPIRPS
jgi:hypothetical protein